MNVHRGRFILKNKEVLVEGRDVYYGWNKIRSHSNKFETIEHFITKAIVGKLIMVKGDGMISEHEYPDGNVIDILQVKKNELIGYQIESNDYVNKDFKDTATIVIELKKAPENIKQAFKDLKEYFERFIV